MSTWDHFHNWNLVLPPSRPSAEQLANISKIIASIDRAFPVAVLGSTPEFRDLLFEEGFTDVHVLEKNKNFFDVATAMRVNASEETLTLGDWLDTLPMLASTFSAILSDLTSGNVPYHQRRAFYRGIENALAHGSVFIDKVLTHPGRHDSLDAILDKYKAWPVNLETVNRYSCETLFCSELLEHGEVDSSLFYSILDARSPTPRLRAFARKARLITPEGCHWSYGRPWDAIKTEYCPNLLLDEYHTEPANSPYFGRARYFQCRKPTS